MNMQAFNYDNPSYDNMSIQQLADLRSWQLERLTLVSQALRDRVASEYTPGDDIKKLAKRIGVTRATIYSWIHSSK